MKVRHTAETLRAMPTIKEGHFENLKMEYFSATENKMMRVWLSRCGVADGLPYDDGVRVELFRNGRWATACEYQG